MSAMPTPPYTVPEILADAVAADPYGTAIIEADQTITYRALQDRAVAASNVLRNFGLNRGDTLALWAPNSADWIVAAIGAHMRGAVLVPLNTRFKAEEAVSIILRTKAKLVLATESFLGNDNAKALEQDIRLGGTRVISIDGTGPLDWRGCVNTAQIDQGQDPSISLAQPDDISDYIFTSGTTGLPKAVATTHRQTTGNARAWGEAVGLTTRDAYLIVNPFFHTFGYKAGWIAALCFRTAILPMAMFDVDTTCGLIERHRVTILPGPPTLFEDLLRFDGRQAYDLSSLRAAVTGAAVVPAELVRRMQSDLGIEQVMTAYGMTETCGVATISGRRDPLDKISTTCGKPLADVELKISDDEGRSMALGETGEVWLRSKYNFHFYLDDDEATRETYSSDGWLKTGDLGKVDDSGYLTINGRKKDMFICGGFNCYPAEIEFQLKQHTDVEEAAVIGIPDSRMGEVGIAFIITHSDASLAESALLDWAKSNIANYKVPRKFVFVSAFPRNALGKIEKHKLSALIEDQSASNEGNA